MAEKSVGLIELSSIAAGFQVADTMLKAGNVRLILSRSICSGKYMVLIGGDAAAVPPPWRRAAQAAGGCLIDSFVIANLHPDVFMALGRTSRWNRTARWASSNRSTSPPSSRPPTPWPKPSDVQLLEVRLAMAMGGKAFCSMTGDVSSVQAGVAAGRAVLAEAGVLVNAVVVSRPPGRLSGSRLNKWPSSSRGDEALTPAGAFGLR